MVRTAGMDGVVDQIQHTGETERHATGFLPGNRLTQKEKCEEHGEDRAQGTHDGRIDRGGHRDSDQE